MASDGPNVFTIASDRPFLETLARAVLDGFPLAGGLTQLADLPKWTILLPTRRAARELEAVFHETAGQRSLLLPRIRPIGDIEEGLLAGDMPTDEPWRPGIPPAIGETGQALLLIGLIDQWAAKSPQIELASEIRAAPHRAHALALSLLDLLNALEIDEVDFSRFRELYDIEIARHREAVLDLLAIVRSALPGLLQDRKLVGPVARRALILRAEARRLAELRPANPIIAAGSTGSMPAARELLKSIALLPGGALVLPGLDTAMDDESWDQIGPQHPQHLLRSFVSFLGVERKQVPCLGGGGGRRAWLAGEIMRPPGTSENWREAVTGGAAMIGEAMAGIELVEAPTVHDEALIIALMLRKALEEPKRRACLITPDRGLARRVKSELRRWNIDIDDSAGEPLSRMAGASLMALLLAAWAEGFSPALLLPLLRHDYCLCGAAPEDARRHASVIELCLFRTGLTEARLGHLASRLKEIEAAENEHRHPAIERIGKEDWHGAVRHAARFEQALAALQSGAHGGLAASISAIVGVCESLAGEALWNSADGDLLFGVIEDIKAGEVFLNRCDMARASAILLHSLHATQVRPLRLEEPRISILGLLEARLMRPDMVILGGLNEGIWPGQPDPGPWLNRPMRETLSMPQPERQIGQTAHDFVQALAVKEVKLVWARRLGNDPAIPSRFVLRLKMLLAGAKHSEPSGENWVGLAMAMRTARNLKPHARPRPLPPLEARPRRLSVSRIEQLLRDPYAIYARHVLELEPLHEVGAVPDHALKGIIFHDIIGTFLKTHGETLPADIGGEIMALASRCFGRVRDAPGALAFWWPRFRRIAGWFAEQERAERPSVQRVLAEISGALDLEVAPGFSFRLTCRADRIDVLKDGSARIADYKTGHVPSQSQVEQGLAPQLGLEAAILQGGGFGDVGTLTVSDLSYIKLSGGEPPAKVKSITTDISAPALAEMYLARLTGLIAAYRSETRPYLPRTFAEKDEEELDYDHLSRFREWSLVGGAP